MIDEQIKFLSFCSIEHVYPNVLEEIPFHIFGIVKPKLVILTTPNSDFNVLFDMKPGEFRHWDHKFEWTRSEFQDWCNNICARFPDYCVQFHGIGKSPEGFESLGCCSQLGLFIRKEYLETLNKDENTEVLDESNEPDQVLVEVDGYRLIQSTEYPFYLDRRTREQKILDECSYHINRFRWMGDEYFNFEADRFEIPITAVANACWQFTDRIDEVQSVLKANFEIEGDFVILPPNEEEESEAEIDEEMDA